MEVLKLNDQQLIAEYLEGNEKASKNYSPVTKTKSTLLSICL